MKKNNKLFTIFNYTLLIIFAILMLFPLIWMLRSSFMSNGEIFEIPMRLFPKELRYQNYIDVMTLRPFGRWLLNSFTLVVVNVLGSMFTCSIVAYGFARINFTGRKLWFSLMISTMMIPGAALLIPQFIEWKMLGAYNTYWPLIMGSFGAPAFYTFLIRQFFMGIPKEYDEAAYIDGANHFKIYSKIMLPLSKPALTAVGIFTFTGVWNDFMGPLIYISDEMKYTASLGLRTFLGFFVSQWELLMAASTVFVIPMIVVFFLAQNAFISGITFTGLKG